MEHRSSGKHVFARADTRSIQIIDLKNRIGLLRRHERGLREMLSYQRQIGSRKLKAHAELDRVLNEIATLNEELKKVEAEP